MGDVVLVEAGDTILSDGEVIEGIASSTRPQSPSNPHRSSANRGAIAPPF
jgi:hypothetical protein